MRTYRLPVLTAAVALLAACGGGGDTNAGGGGGTPPIPPVSVSAGSTATNTARLGDLNAFRGDCDGTALQGVASNNGLITAALRHAGWQAIDDATQAGQNLNHNEPRSNALFSANNFGDRIRAGNGGANIPGYNSYYEDIASTAGATAITQLWNTVYHRIPMMRHQAHSLGYGDMAMARADYPAAGVPATDEWGNSPAGNGYATMDWAGYSTPTITLSYWPGSGTTNVPHTFFSDYEAPDPVSGRNQVGCPIHVILPATGGAFSQVNITLTGPGPVSIPLSVLAGNGSPTGAAGDVSSLAGDPSLAPNELFILPIPAPTNTGLLPSTNYTYSVQVTFNGTQTTLPNVTYTTAAP